MTGARRVASVQAGGGGRLQAVDASIADWDAAVLDEALEDGALVPVAVVKVDAVAMLRGSLRQDFIAQSHSAPVVGLQLFVFSHVSVRLPWRRDSNGDMQPTMFKIEHLWEISWLVRD